MPTVRVPNFFEKILLVIGILVIIVGYGVIHSLVVAGLAFGWELVAVIFLWLMLISLVIILAVTENMKEELKSVSENQATEIRLLRKEMENHRK